MREKKVDFGLDMPQMQDHVKVKKTKTVKAKSKKPKKTVKKVKGTKKA